MLEPDVSGLSQMFGLEKEIVEGSIKDGTLSVRIKDALSKKHLYSPEEFETFKKNHAAEVIDQYYSELVEKAKKGDIPQDLFKPVKGASLQQKERELSKKYEITDYQGLDDLIDKAISKTTANGKGSPDVEKVINELKEANLRLLKEKDEAVNTVTEQFKTQGLERDASIMMEKIPFDLREYKSNEVADAKRKQLLIFKSVFNSEYSLDYNDKLQVVVKDKNGNILKNSATLEPLSPEDVMLSVAKNYNMKLMSSETGGQGGESSTTSAAPFKDHASFLKWCKNQNIMPTSKEAIIAWKKSGLRE